MFVYFVFFLSFFKKFTTHRIFLEENFKMNISLSEKKNSSINFETVHFILLVEKAWSCMQIKERDHAPP